MILAENKKGKFDYQILKTWEAGIVLAGYEVKAIRNKQISLKEAYVTVNINPQTKKLQANLINCHITLYKKSGPMPDYSPTRTRRLLLHQKEISSIYGQIQPKGLTLIPLKVYTKGTKIKLEIGLGKGKKLFDKKEVIKKRDLDREIKRELKNKS